MHGGVRTVGLVSSFVLLATQEHPVADGRDGRDGRRAAVPAGAAIASPLPVLVRDAGTSLFFPIGNVLGGVWHR